VRRIWADGNLLRGQAGDFKTETGFRLCSGDDDQAVDPLIAAAEGAGLTPALRGCAYAVFENLQLADFGNRIPSLTFEVVADDGPVSAGTIAAEVSDGVIDGDGATLPLTGFSAYGDSARAVLDTLATAAGAWFAPVGATLAMRTDGAPSATIGDDAMAASGDTGARAMRSIAPIATVPQTVSLGYYDPARDFQTGLQRARRPGAGIIEQAVDMPAVISAGDAKTMAEAVLARAEAARETRTIAAGWQALDVAPGAVVAIRGETGRWRVTGWSLEAMVLQLSLVQLAAEPIAASGSPGRVLATPDALAGTTILHAFEAPPLDDAVLDQPRLLIAACGTQPGWRRASLLLSLDNGARWASIGRTAAPAVIGTIIVPPAVAGAALVDRRSMIEVALVHEGMTLADADAAALDGGANLAMVGDELLQFGRAEPIAPLRWRLSTLWRGRRGTEAMIGQQRPGDRFVLISRDTVMATSVPVSAIGGRADVLASGRGDDAGPAATGAAVNGASVLPPAPVGLSAVVGSDGDVQFRWVRRSRSGWRWLDGVDVPLVEESEAYRITLIDAAGGQRDATTSTPEWTLPASERGAGAITMQVRQIGRFGLSLPAELTIAGN
jgi:hypothetical protein